MQEGLSNALRHGGSGTRVELRITVDEHALELTLDNPLPAHPATVRPGGGRGLHGITERAVLLGGSARSGPDTDGRWRLRARLPLHHPGQEHR